MTKPVPNCLVCRCSLAGRVPATRYHALMRRLEEVGAEVREVDDLCGMAARRDPGLRAFAGGDAAGGGGAGKTVAACRARAVKWLFAFSGAPLPSGTVLLDLVDEAGLDGDDGDGSEALTAFMNAATRRTPTVADVSDEGASASVRPAEADAAGPGDLSAPAPVEGVPLEDERPWLPWFPVVDFDRCTGCGQCKAFCLFDVFAEAEDKIEVRRPANCKAYCPACARVCPEGALIFPKYHEAPIDGGEPPAGSGEPSAVDLKTLLSGDLMDQLRRRGGSDPTLADAARRLAEAERSRCACKRGCGKDDGGLNDRNRNDRNRNDRNRNDRNRAAPPENPHA